MVVTHLNVYDNRGGAARAAYRLHQGLQSRGVTSRIFSQHKTTDDPAVIECRPPDGRCERWLALLRQRLIARAARRYQAYRRPGMELFTDARPLYGSSPLRQIPPADLFHLHWIARFIDVGDLARRTAVPLVWTLHDMNPFTGGCHYSAGCDRYLQGCGCCPQLGSRVEHDLSRRNFLHKERALSAVATERLQIVTPSRWLAQLVAKSPLLGKFRISVIPNGVDLRVFRPHAKVAARTSLQIPATAMVVMFVADSLNNDRKGFPLLAQLLHRFTGNHDYRLIAVGRADTLNLPGANVKCFGNIYSDDLLVSLLSAADVFVIPSREDNSPNTVLEAMACGVPVVGFAAGGIPEMVDDNRCGLLVPVGDVEALWQAVRTVCEDAGRQQELSRNAAAAVGHYTIDHQARRYLDLYRLMLA